MSNDVSPIDTTPPREATDNQELVRALNRCIETCTDGQKGYGIAAADIRALDLKVLCEQSSLQRAEFVTALQSAIRKLGGFPENEGTFAGPLRREWASYRKLVEGPDDRVVLEGCADAEVASIETYEAADRAVLHPAPEEVRAMVQGQYAAIRSALADLRARLAPVS